MELFPYKPRKNQNAIMETIHKTLRSGENLVFESGTGSGKTICTITSTLEYCLKNDKKIVYTTRTNAQQRQVLLELRKIRENLKKTEEKEDIFGVGIQGRGNMCLFAKNNPDFEKGTSEELSRLCSKEKKKTRSNKNKGCPYYQTFLQDKEKENKCIKWFKENLPTAEEFTDFCEKNKICPYELNKSLVKISKLVVVPYIYVFDVTIRNMLLDWLGLSEKDIILVVDEAHNLPDYLRDLFSSQLSFWMLKNCRNEAKKYGDPSMLDGRFTVSSFCKTLSDILLDFRDTYVY
ncbi:MAG: DEAD/DEAH box helicase, partial [Candidatus Thermoplasmatota archaeon]